MTSGDPLQAEASADDQDTAPVSGAAASFVGARTSVESDLRDIKTDAESREDEAWMEACRTELEDSSAETHDFSAAKSATADRDSKDLGKPASGLGDGNNEADPTDSPERGPAIKKTGDDAMSKFGHAIGALAESEVDLDDHAIGYSPEPARPAKSRDDGVAPHIAAAERELERSKSSGPVDIFDRIAQAAESQFDESRGSTTRRVSELVDDRRVGTKRWTPSKTMKKRMEKLEAARAAAAAGTSVADSKNATAPEASAEPKATAASAPTSSTATIVTPNAQKKAVVEPAAEAAPMTEEQKVTISRRDRHPDAKENTEMESAGAEEVGAEEEEMDADGLRVVPGARGRRRDRARKSRLDEDFEKIFDDEGKPSINTLRRKLRSEEAAAAAAAEESETSESSSTESSPYAMDASDAPKKGLLARLFKSKGKKVAATAAAGVATAAAAATVAKSRDTDEVDAPEIDEEDFGIELDAAPAKKKSLFSNPFGSKNKPAPVLEDDEDDLVAAFESDNVALSEPLDIESDADEDWQAALENEGKRSQLSKIVIGVGVFIALIAVGWVAYKFLMG